MKRSEQQLIVRARKGERAAFGSLVTIYRDRVLALAYDLSGNYTDAQDIAQEVFIKAYRALPFYRGASAFYTWLYRITVNQARDHFRRGKKSMSIENAGEAPLSLNDSEAEADRILDNERMHRSIRAALDNLTEHQRTAVILTYFHGMSSAEAGEVMAVSANTVRTHLLRALGRLKPLLVEIKEMVDE